MLTVGQQAALNLVLKLGTHPGTITVVGESALVDTRSSALSAVVAEKAIEQLPLNGRNYIDLALLQPGVSNFNEKDSSSSSNKGTKLNINGMGYRSNSYLLDGANIRGYAGTATVSAAETTLGVETIREFRVVTNAYSADYGRAMGGVISLVTKSGTNELPRIGLRVRPQQQDGRAQLLRRRGAAAVQAEPVRGGWRRTDQAQQAVLLRRRRAAAGRSGQHRNHHRPECRGESRRVRAGQPGHPAPTSRCIRCRTAAIWATGPPSIDTSRRTPTRENFYQGRVDYNMSENDSLFFRMTTDGADQSIVQRAAAVRHRLRVAEQRVDGRIQADRDERAAQHRALLAQPPRVRAAPDRSLDTGARAACRVRTSSPCSRRPA